MVFYSTQADNDLDDILEGLLKKFKENQLLIRMNINFQITQQQWKPPFPVIL